MKIMTVEEVADYLSVGECVVRQLINKGDIPSFNIAGEPRVQYGSLIRWYQAQANIRSLQNLKQELQNPSSWRKALDENPDFRDQIIEQKHQQGTFGELLKNAASSNYEKIGHNLKPIKNPDMDWYVRRSQSQKLHPRCPFASVYKCPRYYLSLSLLGQAGNSEIPKKLDKKLLKIWKKSELWPTTKEQNTGIVFINNKPKHYNNFCPEVAYERFKIFAINIYSYSDEIDMEVAHKRLSEERANPSDWQWQWSNIEPKHYSECAYFSILLNEKNQTILHEDVIDIKPNFFGIGINFNAILRRLKQLLKKNK